jgi:hypothetical protein
LDRPQLLDERAVGMLEALVIDAASLRALIVAEVELGKRIMHALILRRRHPLDNIPARRPQLAETSRSC